MTEYLPSHPGGLALLNRAGKDATAAMRGVNMHNISHSFIERKLQQCYIGDVTYAILKK